MSMINLLLLLLIAVQEIDTLTQCMPCFDHCVNGRLQPAQYCTLATKMACHGCEPGYVLNGADERCIPRDECASSSSPAESAPHPGTYVVTGQVLCNERPYPDAKIVLMEKDLITADDELGSTNSGEDGSFGIVAPFAGELLNEKPYLRIEHKCQQQGGKPLKEGCHYNSYYDELYSKHGYDQVAKALYLDGNVDTLLTNTEEKC